MTLAILLLSASLVSDLPESALKDWQCLVERMDHAAIEYQIEVSWLFIDLSSAGDNKAVAYLRQAQVSEGTNGANGELLQQFRSLKEGGSVPGVHVESSIDFRFARAGDRLILESFSNPTTHIGRTGNMAIAYNTGQNSLLLQAARSDVSVFDPPAILQPLPSGDKAEAWLDGDWERVAERTYRNHYAEDRSHRRATVQLDGVSGLATAFWVRPRPEEDSMLAGFFAWSNEGGDVCPRVSLFITSSQGMLKVVRHRVSHWIEPVDEAAVALPISRPTMIRDARGETMKKVTGFELLPEAIRQLFVLTE